MKYPAFRASAGMAWEMIDIFAGLPSACLAAKARIRPYAFSDNDKSGGQGCQIDCGP